jgi:uncharacterized membrane protein
LLGGAGQLFSWIRESDFDLAKSPDFGGFVLSLEISVLTLIAGVYKRLCGACIAGGSGSASLMYSQGFSADVFSSGGNFWALEFVF